MRAMACLLTAVFIFGSASAAAQTSRTAPSVALNYAAVPPLDELRVFDIVVVDGDHAIDPKAYRERTADKSELFAYVAIGEALASRSWFADMPASMRPGSNALWASAVIDQTHPQWPQFFVDRIVAPLWEKGYRGFFLDTMDSYQLLAKDAPGRQAQEAGLITAIKTLKARFPEARLIANRGFEVLPQVRNEVFMVAAESLFKGWNHGEKRYTDVKAEDRDWLDQQLRTARDSLGLQVLVIDYVAPHLRSLQRETAKQILERGFQAYVTDPDLVSIGTGQWQNQPRRILVLHDTEKDKDLHHSDVLRYLQFPLNHLGYRADLHNVNDSAPPDGPLHDRYAGVVTWFSSNLPANKSSLQTWFRRVLREQLPLLSMNELPFPVNKEWAAITGVSEVSDRLYAPLRIATQADGDLVGFESKPQPRLNNYSTVELTPEAISKGAQRWLQIADSRNRMTDAIATTAWGGFVLSSFGVYELPARDRQQWVVNPFELIRQALRLPAIPVPDVSTETGRRLLMVHIDGDGFASRAEIKGTPFAAAVMTDDFFARYRVPHTVSIIRAEVAGNGLYKELTPALESIARRMFALPNVELATHTYSHPFYWRDAVAGSTKRAYNLQIPGYTFDLDTELKGSAQYVESLAPPGKKTMMVLWSGDCVIPASVLKRAGEFGLLNMNGGDTMITKSHPSMTAVAPFSLRKDGYLQVFAPNQNENVYTNLWTGPFYGFEQVIETFELTESPKRLKPINIYYHTYSASKPAAIAALHKVYGYAMARKTHPVYGSEYARKVIDWESFALAQDVSSAVKRYRLVSDGHLRTVRLARGGETSVDWQASDQIAGFAHAPGFTFVHMAAARAELSEVAASRTGTAQPEPATPWLIDANGKVSNLSKSAGKLSFSLHSHVNPELVLALPERCTVRINQHEIKGKTVQTSEITLNSGVNAVAFTVPNVPGLTAAGQTGFTPALVSVQCG